MKSKTLRLLLMLSSDSAIERSQNYRHFLRKWRLFFALRSFAWVSLMIIVTVYFRT